MGLPTSVTTHTFHDWPYLPWCIPAAQHPDCPGQMTFPFMRLA